ncbi:MAG: VOC family protein [Mitsuaria chitosanitabida]|uniref:VOC family protein n=1 Tax=Roseateles chitosanitabidus TaxID=65048 RepID=UPI001B164C1D|nr:VOC family protein [Roseateles chitosanitabidus]MBO9689574.1 VOC family protein [Roseateles chitosanitabidus]
MTFHRGRLIDHIHLRAADLEASRRFYRAALQALGRADAIREDADHFAADELWIDRAGGPPGGSGSHVHLAFAAKDRAQVDAFHEAVLAAGGLDNGPPGERPYHPGYYGAFVLDPDGNNIEAVYHGPAAYSADSVVIQARMPG